MVVNRRIIFIWVMCCFVIGSLFITRYVFADPPDQLDYHEAYVRAKVIQVRGENKKSAGGKTTYQAAVQVLLLDGNEQGKRVTAYYYNTSNFSVQQRINPGSQVIVDSLPDVAGNIHYTIYAPYRLTDLWYVLGVFMILIIFVAGIRGLEAILGLGVSIAIIMVYILPQILNGQDPLIVCILGAFCILFITSYIAHGLSVRTTTAVAATAVSLVSAAVFSLLFAGLTHVLGIGGQNSYEVQLATTKLIHPQGILLGGIIIGCLGGLNDITITQTITVFTLAKENPGQKLSQLFWKCMNIGREHIISLVNTLVLVYAGSSLALFLYFVFNPAHLPWWIIINDESALEEILRALVGSSALIIAVPLSTLFASFISLQRYRHQRQKSR